MGFHIICNRVNLTLSDLNLRFIHIFDRLSFESFHQFSLDISFSNKKNSKIHSANDQENFNGCNDNLNEKLSENAHKV
jgi:hypothetical protein